VKTLFSAILLLVLALSSGPPSASAKADEWAVWKSEPFPFSICYPADVFQQRRVSDTGHAIALESKDSAQLIAGSIDYTRETLAEPLRMEQERLTHVALVARGENWFVVSGTRVDQALYTKAVRVGDRLIAMRFRYPESLAAKYAPILGRMAECLKFPEDAY
jgi:hypothetical protein